MNNQIVETIYNTELFGTKVDYIGNMPDPKLPSIAIIGARLCSEYGRYMSRTLATNIAQRFPEMQFISGLSLGVDANATKAALKQGNKVYAVVGCGVDVDYPPELTDVRKEIINQGGGIISRVESGTKPKPEYYTKRYKTMMELVDYVLIIEARKKSSCLIAVEEAVKLGKKVYTIPGRITDRLSDGTNLLIKNGIAELMFDGEELVAELERRI